MSDEWHDRGKVTGLCKTCKHFVRITGPLYSRTFNKIICDAGDYVQEGQRVQFAPGEQCSSMGKRFCDLYQREKNSDQYKMELGNG